MPVAFSIVKIAGTLDGVWSAPLRVDNDQAAVFTVFRMF